MIDDEIIITEEEQTEVNQGEARVGLSDEEFIAELQRRNMALPKQEAAPEPKDETAETIWQEELNRVYREAADKTLDVVKPLLVNQALADVQKKINVQLPKATIEKLEKDFSNLSGAQLQGIIANGGHVVYAKAAISDLFISGKAKVQPRQKPETQVGGGTAPVDEGLPREVLAIKKQAEEAWSKRYGQDIKFTKEEALRLAGVKK